MTASSFAELTDAPAGAQRSDAEFLRYFACSAIALGADFALFRMGLWAGIGYAAAAAIGFLAGLALCYALSVKLVFRVRRVSDQRAEFALFAVIGITGLLLTEGLLWLLIGRQGIEPMLAKALAAGLVFFFNFAARKALLFTNRSKVVSA